MGIMWLSTPVLWHSSRVADGYDYDAMTEHERWLLSARWHDWHTADLDYAQTTVELFCAAIGCCLLFNVYSRLRARSSRTNGFTDKLIAVLRYTVARQWQIRFGARNTYYAPPLAAILAVCGLFIFVMTLTLAARPFYWPNPAMGMSPPLATRSGWISIAIMPFMIAFATKVNWVTVLTGTSHEKLQVFHRWSALIMYITSLTHTFPFIVTSIRMGVMEAMWDPKTDPFYWTGVAALIPQTFLVGLSWGIFRNRYYEIFKKFHFVASGIFMVALFLHVDWTLTSWDYFWATLAIWGLSWLVRVGRTFWNTRLGLGAVVSTVGDDLLAIRIAGPAAFKWAPGQHVFVRVFGTGVHAFSSHPFTINSVCASGDGKGAEVELILRVHGGITRALASKVADGREWTTSVAIDGPYGGVHVPLQKYDKVYFLAGGTGATFVFPILADLAAKMAAGGGDVVCKCVELVIAVQDSDKEAWMQPSLNAATAKLPDANTLGVRVYYTRAARHSSESKNAKDIEANLESTSSDSGLTGRPDLWEIVREAHESAEKVAVIACGPESFLYDVRNAVADAQLVIADGFGKCKDLFLHTETYRW